MHNAPSVSYPVGRSRIQAGLQFALWLLGALAVTVWCLQVGHLGWRQMLAVLAVVVAGVAAWWGWRRMGVGSLRWDGQQWFWTESGEPGPVRVSAHLDLQQHLLLCLHTEYGGRIWCWAERQSEPQRWSDLRRAVYSPARPLTEPDGVLGSEP
ncbi:hypothetical protein [Rhodoferax sp.]|uniref:hypothetical protein n=1 Tax=Rhodoferax sp. TaxID=50421 RepID=UPI00374D92C4